MQVSALMQAHQQELARLASEEHGKTLADALGGVRRGIEVIEVRLRHSAPVEGRIYGERRLGR
jgi:acyl-CoA reductase-like NAD-dependent aldehyde dehydrogenase